ncbi:MAG: NAD-dependent epimerase/dehydratase family protein [Planctomycetes bacterium]|nr:NAD-dependent epimerase/dehydratase family protein [Planctomycetota bacterium]
MRFLVTGGTGFVGSHVVDALLARGDEVKALVRDPNRLRWLEGREVRLAPGDVVRNIGLEAALDDVDAVIHAAGVIKAGSEAEFRKGNAGGTENLLEACARSKRGFRSIVVVTSLAALGPPADGVASRDADPARPISAYGRSKAATEDVCAEFEKRIPVVVARPPIVYGPRDDAVLEIFRIVKWHLKPLPNPEQRLSMVHARDLAAGLLAAADRGKAGERYFLAHPEVITARVLANLVESALGVQAVGLGVPPALLKAAAAVSQALTGGRSIFSRDKAAEITAPGWACDVASTKARLGWEARIGHADGLLEAGRWYRGMKWL